jgi:hypothetical protein
MKRNINFYVKQNVHWYILKIMGAKCVTPDLFIYCHYIWGNCLVSRLYLCRFKYLRIEVHVPSYVLFINIWLMCKVFVMKEITSQTMQSWQAESCYFLTAARRRVTALEFKQEAKPNHLTSHPNHNYYSKFVHNTLHFVQVSFPYLLHSK